MSVDNSETLDMFDKFLKTLTRMSNQSAEQFNKQISPLTRLWINSFTILPNVVQAAVKQISERTVELKIDGETNPLYSTEISNDGDIVNNFPNQVPDPSDVYWTRHNLLVDRYLTDRQATIDKVINTVGETAKGVLNPISTITFSPTDLIRLIEEFKK